MQLKTKINRRSAIAAGITALAALGAGIAWRLGSNREPKTTVRAGRISEALPVGDPESPLWRRGARLTVPMINQTMYYPRLWKTTIPQMDVRVLTDGRSLAFLLEWGDDDQNDLESIVGFRDAAAVMLPLELEGEMPPIFMGSLGRPVYILQWKASWQRDMEKGFQDVEQSYPRWFNDVYPGHPTFAALGQSAEDAKQFYPGLAAGNSLSQQSRTSPVEELVAEGFGTLTSLKSQRSIGYGKFDKGWKLSVGLPVGGDDVPVIRPGATVPVAFALWDGGERQVGGRKHYSNWVDVVIPK